MEWENYFDHSNSQMRHNWQIRQFLYNYRLHIRYCGKQSEITSRTPNSKYIVCIPVTTVFSTNAIKNNQTFPEASAVHPSSAFVFNIRPQRHMLQSKTTLEKSCCPFESEGGFYLQTNTAHASLWIPPEEENVATSSRNDDKYSQLPVNNVMARVDRYKYKE